MLKTRLVDEEGVKLAATEKAAQARARERKVVAEGRMDRNVHFDDGAHAMMWQPRNIFPYAGGVGLHHEHPSAVKANWAVTLDFLREILPDAPCHRCTCASRIAVHSNKECMKRGPV
ncbi:hypothetical protein FOA52_002021 [Chlamydomonas sp. UWO 241]|nr:hypothetical protein FOA52_002021 [Chlamydomonas sp. UWO 241]